MVGEELRQRGLDIFPVPVEEPGFSGMLRTGVPSTVSPESGTGHGVQLEAILSYAIGKSFSVGAGGRYWAMWAPGAATNIFGSPCPCQTLPGRTERYGGFVQASYKLDGFN